MCHRNYIYHSIKVCQQIIYLWQNFRVRHAREFRDVKAVKRDVIPITSREASSRPPFVMACTCIVGYFSTISYTIRQISIENEQIYSTCKYFSDKLVRHHITIITRDNVTKGAGMSRSRLRLRDRDVTEL